MNYENAQGLIPAGYGGTQCPSSVNTPTPTLQQRLDFAVQQAKKALEDVTEARDILARNPDLERLLNIMQKGRF